MLCILLEKEARLPIKNIWYRTCQCVMNIGLRLLPWRKATLLEGSGAIRQIPTLLAQQHAQKPLVVTGPTLMATGVSPKVLAVLDMAGLPFSVFSDVPSNPTIDTVTSLVSQYHADSCDSFIAVGGGSPMDAAKATAACIKRPNKSVQRLKGLFKVHGRIAPFIAVPTTAGSGSETTVAALITDSEAHHKFSIMDISLIPHFAVLDPELTVSLPPDITASTGIDALTHAVEAYLCWTYNTAESKQYALDATAAIIRNLNRAYSDGSDIAAREALLDASYRAGYAFTRAGVGNAHAIAHALGGLYNTPHGLANAVLLPVVLEDYGEAVYTKLAALARVSSLASETSSTAEAARAFIAHLRRSNAQMGIPKGFDFIRDEDIDQMITWALKEANPLYPVPVIYDRARCRRVIEKIRI